ncbi:MAG: hypothetical protein ACK5LP_02400 [Campylobacteraceae bacterium]
MEIFKTIVFVIGAPLLVIFLFFFARFYLKQLQITDKLEDVMDGYEKERKRK